MKAAVLYPYTFGIIRYYPQKTGVGVLKQPQGSDCKLQQLSVGNKMLRPAGIVGTVKEPAASFPVAFKSPLVVDIITVFQGPYRAGRGFLEGLIPGGVYPPGAGDGLSSLPESMSANAAERVMYASFMRIIKSSRRGRSASGNRSGWFSLAARWYAFFISCLFEEGLSPRTERCTERYSRSTTGLSYLSRFSGFSLSKAGSTKIPSLRIIFPSNSRVPPPYSGR